MLVVRPSTCDLFEKAMKFFNSRMNQAERNYKFSSNCSKLSIALYFLEKIQLLRTKFAKQCKSVDEPIAIERVTLDANDDVQIVDKTKFNALETTHKFNEPHIAESLETTSETIVELESIDDSETINNYAKSLEPGTDELGKGIPDNFSFLQYECVENHRPCKLVTSL